MARTAFITGSSTGFGKATAVAFCDAGWNVVATMRKPQDWDREPSDRLLPIALDVTEPASIRSAFEAGVAAFGRVDAVVNIAGIAAFSVFETTPDKMVRLLFETNLFGPLELMRVAIPHLREHGGGHLVNLTSASSIVPEPLMAAYNASKAALDNFSETARLELAPQNIEVKIIEPGFVPTTALVPKLYASAPTLDIPPAYAAYVQQRMSFFAQLAAEPPVPLPTAEDVAQTILASVNDDARRLRWVVGEDQNERMRMKWSTSEPEYTAWSWREFGPAS